MHVTRGRLLGAGERDAAHEEPAVLAAYYDYQISLLALIISIISRSSSCSSTTTTGSSSSTSN